MSCKRGTCNYLLLLFVTLFFLAYRDVDTGTLFATYRGSASAPGCVTLLGLGHFAAGVQLLFPSPAALLTQGRHAAQSSKGAFNAWSWSREPAVLQSFLAEPLCCVSASPCGGLLAGGAASGSLSLWHAPTGRLLRRWGGHVRCVTRVVWCPDSSWLLSASADATVAAWSLHALSLSLADGGAGCCAGAAPAHVWSWHTRAIDCLAVGASAGAVLIASGSADRKVCVWTLCGGGALLSSHELDAPVTALCFDAAEAELFAAAADGRIRGLRLDGGREGLALDGHARTVRALAPTADGARLVSAGDDGAVKARRCACPLCALTTANAAGLVFVLAMRASLVQPRPVRGRDIAASRPTLVAGFAGRVDWGQRRAEAAHTADRRARQVRPRRVRSRCAAPRRFDRVAQRFWGKGDGCGRS